MTASCSWPKRILMTADTVGGVWTYALELARGLAPYGVEVALATMGRWLSREQRQQLAGLPNVEVFESDYRLEWMPNAWRAVDEAGDWLLGVEQRVEPHVIQLNGYAHGGLRWQSPKLVVGHSCVLSWWQAVRGTSAPAEWGNYRTRVQAGLTAADLVVAPSAQMLECLRRHYGPLPHARIIPNGRRLETLKQRPKEKFILSAGRLWDAAKNISTLAAIAPELPWPVCLAGDPGPPGAAQRGNHPAHRHAVLGTGVWREAMHLGRLSPAQLLPWFERAAIYAAPARYEPFGLSILEAAQAGCALVLGDIASLRELWTDAAVFVPPTDAEELTEVLRELSASPAWRGELGIKAKARAERYSPESMAAAYLATYQELLGQPVLASTDMPVARGARAEYAVGRTVGSPRTTSARGSAGQTRCVHRRARSRPEEAVR